MKVTSPHDPLNAALEVREQMATHERRIAFLLGAGTSIAAGLPGMESLTNAIELQLTAGNQALFTEIRKSLRDAKNIEDVLDHLRILWDLLGDDKSKLHDGISGVQAKELDRDICRAICKAVSTPDPAKMNAHYSLALWTRQVRRDKPIEIFTTNYDLVLEMGFEYHEVPFFDGFLGAVNPFFVPESVEVDGGAGEDTDPPKPWTRLWKIHGSVNWQLKENGDGHQRVVRSASQSPESELVIYPTREKHAVTRRFPFVNYMDRMRRILSSGECLLIVIGYSFRDQHVNDLLRQSLRTNPRLAVNTFTYEEPSADIQRLANTFKNFSLYGPRSACLGGKDASWQEPSRAKQPGEEWPFWDDATKQFCLGDFDAFGKFLAVLGGGPVAPVQSFAPVATSAPVKPSSAAKP